MEPADMNNPSPSRPTPRIPWWPAALTAALFLAAALPVILTGWESGRGAYDQVHYHEPAILRFAEQLPSPDLSDYLSATTPGYHLFLAVLARTVSDSPTFLRTAATVFTVTLLALFTRWLTPRVGPGPAVGMGFALGASLYVFSAGAFLLPDNAAWLGVLTVLLIALRDRFDRVTLAAGGAVTLALVLTRQSHLWVLAPLLTAAWLGPRFAPRPGVIGEVRSLFDQPAPRAGRAIAMLLALTPAILAILWFVRLWGGLTVPIYHDYMQGINPATPAFILAQLGVIAVFHAGYWIRPGLRLVRARPGLVAALAAAGFLLAVLPETTYSVENGRYSGLWNAVRALPVIAGRTSPLLLILAPAGALALGAWLAGVSPRHRWILLAALAGFTAAVSASHYAWQRYHEPMLLITAAVLSALNAADREPHRPRWLTRARAAGPFALAALLAAITIKAALQATPAGPPMEVQSTVERPLRDLWPTMWRRLDRPDPAPSRSEP